MSQLFFLATILFPNIGLGLSSSLWKQFLLVALEAWGSICVSMYWLSEVRQCIHTNTGASLDSKNRHLGNTYRNLTESLPHTRQLLSRSGTRVFFWLLRFQQWASGRLGEFVTLSLAS